MKIQPTIHDLGLHLCITILILSLHEIIFVVIIHSFKMCKDWTQFLLLKHLSYICIRINVALGSQKKSDICHHNNLLWLVNIAPIIMDYKYFHHQMLLINRCHLAFRSCNLSPPFPSPRFSTYQIAMIALDAKI